MPEWFGVKQETRSLLGVWDFAKKSFWAAKEGSGRLRWTAISGGVWIIVPWRPGNEDKESRLISEIWPCSFQKDTSVFGFMVQGKNIKKSNN